MAEQITSYSALLGQIVGLFRQQRGLEQRTLAEALGLSQASYSRLEGGKAQWSIDQLMVVAERLGVSVTEIIEMVQQQATELKQSAGVEVIAVGRANSRGEANKDNTGAMLAGAALGALIMTLIMKK